jgi:hypothetical protein
MKTNKFFIISILIILLSACATLLQNPYESYSKKELSKLSTYELCKSVSKYKNSSIVKDEITRRGFKDCSDSELYCQENLGLKPQTREYINCRLLRDQQNLQATGMMLNYLQSTQPQKLDMDISIQHRYFPF